MTFRDPSRISLTRRRFIGPGTPHPHSTDPLADARASRPRRIVLTGGPGSGKSTAASFLAREFNELVWVLPESATLMYRGGMPRGATALGRQVAQRSIFNTQRALEVAHGEQNPGRVQICDRGTVDGAAYWPGSKDDFFAAMHSTHERELGRYDAVIFMHTAALLPAGYERDLEVRTEDRELAIELDQRIFGLFADHPRVIPIESRGSFLDKLIAVRAAVATLLDVEQINGSGEARRGAGVGVPLSTLASLGSIPQELVP